MLQRVPPLRFGRFGPVLSHFDVSPNDDFREPPKAAEKIIIAVAVVSHRGNSVIRMLEVSNEQSIGCYSCHLHCSQWYNSTKRFCCINLGADLRLIESRKRRKWADTKRWINHMNRTQSLLSIWSTKYVVPWVPRELFSVWPMWT